MARIVDPTSKPVIRPALFGPASIDVFGFAMFVRLNVLNVSQRSCRLLLSVIANRLPRLRSVDT